MQPSSSSSNADSPMSPSSLPSTTSLRSRPSVLKFDTALGHDIDSSSIVIQTDSESDSPSSPRPPSFPASASASASLSPSFSLSPYLSPPLDPSLYPTSDCEPEHDPKAHSTTVRHQDLWFVDGSVVLRAENTLYKVHISQLSRHSAFFRDLFELPQPEDAGARDGERLGSGKQLTRCLKSPMSVSSMRTALDANDVEFMEGCPLVYLHDFAEDVGNLLTALYDGPSFGKNDQDDFRMVSGILRLSTKYLCDNLRAKALAHLSVAWPYNIRGWDAREDVARCYEMEALENTGIYPSPIAVIKLANEVDAPSLLPSAFYDLSRYSYSQIFDDPDGTQSSLPPTSQTLSLSDIRKLNLGKEACQQAITSLIQSMGNNSALHHPLPQHHHSHSHSHSTGLPPHLGLRNAKACASAAACRKDFTELVELATQHYLFDRERGYGDPLYVAEELGQLKSAEMSGSECKACAKMLEMWAAKERERIWKLIPIWFKLEVAG